MSDTQTKPWSDNVNAPKIPYDLYFAEKASFAGILLASILYGTPKITHLYACTSALNSLVLGTLTVLFFQCVALLLSSVNRKREGVKWGLICYTMVMFSCATVVIGTTQNIASVSFIDNREYPGIEGVFPPGPLGYQSMICSKAPGIAPNLTTLLSYWLADGLLVCSILDPPAQESNASSSSFTVVS